MNLYLARTQTTKGFVPTLERLISMTDSDNLNINDPEVTVDRQKPSQPLTIITTHLNPDYDAVGSMVGARKLYPEAFVVFPGGSEKNLRHFFIQSLIQMINPVALSDIDLGTVERLVVVDTRQPSRLGDVQAVLSNPGLDIHIYDHHPDAPGDLKGSVEIIKKVGATVTIITDIIRQKNIELSSEEATMMAVGLYEDTGSLTFSSTTGEDYQAGAELLSQGADLNIVSQLTVRELTPTQLALLNELVDSAETRQARGLNFVIATAQMEHYVDDVAVLAHKMIEIMGISILFILVGMENKVQLVIRSRLGTVNAALIAREFGGGGHPSAAAANIKNMSLTQAKEKLDAILMETLGTFYNARNLMVYPPIMIAEDESLQEAREVLLKFTVNVILVKNNEGKVVGFISEHNVSRALHHGLLDYPVSAFMNTEFISVTPDTPFKEVKEIIVDRKQRVLPVMEEGKAIGVITRTDLLQVLAGASLPEGGGSNGRSGAGRRNINSLMIEIMPAGLFSLLEKMGAIADAAGSNLYAVGGCVRDVIMRKSCQDIDLSLDGDIDEFITAVTASTRIQKVIRHARFKTATLETEDGYKVDISATRREYYEHPGALPVIHASSLRMDLYRRDFTINSLAASLSANSFGELVDFYRGYQDIKDGYIRVLHNLSFVEDPTRAFRAIRFEARLGFKISKMTATLLEGMVKNKFLTNIDHRRLLNELKLILSEDDPAPAIKRMSDFGLLPFIHPQLALKQQHAGFFNRVRQVRDWLALTFPKQLTQAWFVYFMAITDGLKAQDIAGLTKSLGLKKRETEILTTERPIADDIIARNKKPLAPLAPSITYRLMSGLSSSAILYLMAKTENHYLSQAGVSFLTNYSKVKPLSTGNDLMSLGLKPGPGISQAYEALRWARLDGKVISKADEVEFIKRLNNKESADD